MKFNLVDEPWIPCVTAAGVIARCGLLDTLARAHEYNEIRDQSPLVTVSLHRLLLAILHRIFGPESPEVWAQLWQGGAGNFDRSKLEAYLKKPENYGRFDLFDDNHPFYQTGSLPLGEVDQRTGRPKFVKPVWQMAHELAYSDHMSLFSHFTEREWGVRSADEAARWLVAFQGFSLSGTITTEGGRKRQDGSADAGQLVKSAVALVRGENLFQTFMLNLVHYSAEDETPFAFRKDEDKPAWERDGETKAIDRRYDGYLDLLTWQSRRVKLVPELDLNGKLGVSGVVAMKGFQLPDLARFRRETMVGFVKKENARGTQDPWPPLGFQAGKDLWRDCHVLLQSVAEKTERPTTLKWIDELRQSGTLTQKRVRLDVAGLSSDRAKIYFWRYESWRLPLAYLNDVTLLESLKHILNLAEKVNDALLTGVRAAAATALKPGKDEKSLGKKERDAAESLARSLRAENLYWSRLQEPFELLIEQLADPVEADRSTSLVRNWFTAILCREALNAYQHTAGTLQHSSRALRALVTGEARLRRILGFIAAEYQFGPDQTTKGDN